MTIMLHRIFYYFVECHYAWVLRCHFCCIEISDSGSNLSSCSTSSKILNVLGVKATISHWILEAISTIFLISSLCLVGSYRAKFTIVLSWLWGNVTLDKGLGAVSKTDQKINSPNLYFLPKFSKLFFLGPLELLPNSLTWSGILTVPKSQNWVWSFCLTGQIRSMPVFLSFWCNLELTTPDPWSEPWSVPSAIKLFTSVIYECS